MAQRVTLTGVVLVCLFGLAASRTPAASHDSGRIAFTTDHATTLRRVAEYSVSQNGLTKRRVRTWPRGFQSFVSSPDRKRIVFVKYEHGGSALFVASATGTDARRLTPPEVSPFGGVTFSPDGRRVAFAANLGIYVVGIRGTGLRRLGGVGKDPTWSPDGRRLAYAGDLKAGVGYSIFVVVARTSRSQRFGRGDRPAWAPGGGRVAYRTSDGRSTFCVVTLRTRHRHCVAGAHARRIMWSPTGLYVAVFGGPGLRERDRLAVIRPDGTGFRVVTRQVAGGAGWSRDGRQLAYVGLTKTGFRIYLRNALKPGAARLLARESPHALIGCCSFRGGRVAYTVYLPEDDLELAVVNADGSAFRALTNNYQDDQAPAWSPDGGTIVYSRQTVDYTFREQTTTSLRLIGADGSDDRTLTKRGPWQDVSPTWSPDGRRVAFVRMSHGDGTLMIVELTDRTIRTVTTPGPVSPEGITWSPDGEWIAFTFGNGNELELIHPDGTGHHAVSTGNTGSYSPSWAPDGSRIAVVSTDGLFTLRPDGSQRVLVTQNALARTTWSPDSQRLAFSRTSPTNTAESDLWVIPSDGGAQVQLTHDPSANRSPAWSR